jgi:hypothetical protein
MEHQHGQHAHHPHEHDERGHPAIPPGSPVNDIPGIILGLLLFTLLLGLLIGAGRTFPNPAAPDNTGPRLGGEPHSLIVPYTRAL